jgi:hypothetical protein
MAALSLSSGKPVENHVMILKMPNFVVHELKT